MTASLHEEAEAIKSIGAFGGVPACGVVSFASFE